MSWFIPTSIHQGDLNRLERATLTVKFAKGYANIAIGFSPVLYFLVGPAPAIHNFFTSILVFFAPILMRWTGSLRITCHALVFCIMVMLVGVSFMMGGIKAPTTPSLLIGPMAAVLLMGRRAGVFWAGGAILCVVIMALLAYIDYPLPSVTNPGAEIFLRCSGYSVLMVLVLFFFFEFDGVKRQATEVMQAANRRITKMIVHVEATNSALSRSAAEFFGADSSYSGSGNVGLTQQMMSTAGSGRRMLDGVGESLHGMIGQYKQISQRIHDLHKQSGAITELVRTIDTISDRLDLMALNTGIEAAHAGESGKRFRLLADDMRRLAERVSAETKRIKAALRQVQRHTDAAIEASMMGQALTDEGTAKLDLMSKAFDEMYQLIEQTAEASQRITEDTRNQITAIRQLADTSLQSQASVSI